jgi:L-fuculose-phosphate aldolase
VTTTRLGAEREAVVAHGRRLLADGLAVGTAGNLSIRHDDLVAISPSGVPYEALTPAQVSVVDLHGALVQGPPPSSALPLHLAIYATTPHHAVVHTHAGYATALGLVLDELPPVHYLIADLGGAVPVVPYAAPGSDALARALAPLLQQHTAALLRNHGTVTVGPTLPRAYARSLTLEWLCMLYHRARVLGEPAVLPPDAVSAMASTMRRYFDRSSGAY